MTQATAAFRSTDQLFDAYGEDKVRDSLQLNCVPALWPLREEFLGALRQESLSPVRTARGAIVNTDRALVRLMGSPEMQDVRLVSRGLRNAAESRLLSGRTLRL